MRARLVRVVPGAGRQLHHARADLHRSRARQRDTHRDRCTRARRRRRECRALQRPPELISERLAAVHLLRHAQRGAGIELAVQARGGLVRDEVQRMTVRELASRAIPPARAMSGVPGNRRSRSSRWRLAVRGRACCEWMCSGRAGKSSKSTNGSCGVTAAPRCPSGRNAPAANAPPEPARTVARPASRRGSATSPSRRGPR